MATYKFITAAILAASITGQVHAATLNTGNELKDACTDSEDFDKDLLCIEYIIEGIERGEKNKDFCKPELATFGQVQTILVKYLDDHPEILHHPADDLFTDAFQKAFPCTGGE